MCLYFFILGIFEILEGENWIFRLEVGSSVFTQIVFGLPLKLTFFPGNSFNYFLSALSMFSGCFFKLCFYSSSLSRSRLYIFSISYVGLGLSLYRRSTTGFPSGSWFSLNEFSPKVGKLLSNPIGSTVFLVCGVWRLARQVSFFSYWSSSYDLVIILVGVRLDLEAYLSIEYCYFI